MKRFLFPVFLVVIVACSKDENPPVVELAGRNPDTVYVKTRKAYPDAGATATDAEDGTVDVIVSGEVNMNQPGHYTLTYSAQDKSNNFSDEVHRHVEVIKAEGSYSAFENCNSSGANNYFFSASTNTGMDTITLTDFPVSTYVTKAVAKNGGFEIFHQTVSPVMEVEGSISCENSKLTISYTRTSLQGPGTSESCTATATR